MFSWYFVSSTLVRFVVIFVVIAVLNLGAAHPPAARADKPLPSLSLSLVKQIDKTPFLSKLQRASFRYLPTGAPQRVHPPECTGQALESGFPYSDVASQAQYIDDYFQRCGKTVSRFHPIEIKTILNMMSVDYKIKNHEGFYETKFTLPSGIIQRGLLAVKDTSVKRPLVVVICGTACDTLGDGPNQLLMALSDATPFNVLVLRSTTSSSFLRENKRFDLGGFIEGALTMEVLRLIADSSSYLYNLTSSIHLVGVSLGGHAALYAGLFASLHPLAAAGPQLQSVMGYCPVIRLKETLQRLDSEDSLYGRHYRSVIWDEVSGFPNLVDLPLVKPGRNEAVTFLEKVLLRIYKEGTSLPYLYPEPYKGLKIKTAEDYWDANDFTRFYRDMRIPTMVIASENDPVVAAEPNSLYFKKILAQAPHSDIGVVTFPLGFHCAAQIIYGLDVFVPLFRDFILSHSPEFHVKTASFALAAAVPAKALSLEKGEKYFGGDWSIKERQTRATLDLIVFEPNKIFANRLCSSWSPYYAPHECFRNISLRIPLLALFGSGDASRKYPRTEVDAQILTRWLNLRVKIQTAAGDQLIATREPPATLTYEMQ